MVSMACARMKLLIALLCLALPMAACAADAPSALVEGRDYVLVEGGQPYRPLEGKVEVVEVFAYTCPHCADFQPAFGAWAARQPDDVRVTYVPAPFGPGETWARAFFVAEEEGRSEEHTSELQSRENIVCRLLLEKKKTPSGHASAG